MTTGAPISNVVLVHGGFVDGSGWQGVYNILTRDGYNVGVVQNPTLSLEGDVAATQQVIDEQPGPVVLVGHSYGGAVITEAGTHDKVAALGYISAFAPDAGESVNALIAGFPQDGPQPPILPPKDGVADEADLVPAHDTGQDDPAGRTASHVAAGRRHRHRGGGEPLRLRVAAGDGGGAHRAGRRRMTGCSRRSGTFLGGRSENG
jgi:pimeloyl-ACP methyl ester carboxylesterase